jgi:non-ribosomal peptide synthetase component F
VYSTEDRISLSETMPMPNARQHEEISAATIFHAACAVALSRQFQQKEVVFGRLVTGRSMLPSSLQNVVGPTMTEVPIRIVVGENDKVSDVALQLQSRFIEDATHEAAAMVEIIQNCTSWPAEARDFGWRTAFQQDEDSEFTFLGAPSSISFYQRDMPPRSRPEVYATPKDGRLELEFEGNRKLVAEETVKQFFAQLRGALDEYAY